MLRGPCRTFLSELAAGDHSKTRTTSTFFLVIVLYFMCTLHLHYVSLHFCIEGKMITCLIPHNFLFFNHALYCIWIFEGFFFFFFLMGMNIWGLKEGKHCCECSALPHKLISRWSENEGRGVRDGLVAKVWLGSGTRSFKWVSWWCIDNLESNYMVI